MLGRRGAAWQQLLVDGFEYRTDRWYRAQWCLVAELAHSTGTAAVQL